jgi:3-deoxy-D-manno-octulosonate 8-phosphate phosphatase (KDO 8-P phosphatase)
MSPRTASGDLSLRIRRVRLVVFDFDGVLTDNTVAVFADGTEAVTCWRGDGLGLSALKRLGLELFVLSTETNPVVSARCRKLAIPCRQGCEDKKVALAELAREKGVGLEQVAYVGNDINDLECLEAAGLPIVVADAHPSVRKAGRWRTRAPGGRGAVREICDRFALELTSAPRGSRHAS